MSADIFDDPKIQRVLTNDSLVDLLLRRLKQSISTCDELLKFIRKKLICEDEHYNQMRKILKNTKESLKHDLSQLRNDSFLSNFEQICGFDEKLFQVGSLYVKLLTQMYDQLNSLSSTVQRNRKMIKEESKRKDKECIELIQLLDKLKTKYNNLCNELERLKGADPQKKTFTLKGSKTSSQQEEDLLRKVELADLDYKSKVVHGKKLKDEILKFHRPAHTKQVKNLILEIDTLISVQLQKYATWNETLFMNSGVTISPLPTSTVPGNNSSSSNAKKPSMRGILASINNEKDLYNWLVRQPLSGLSGADSALTPIEYLVHPSFRSQQRALGSSMALSSLPMTSSFGSPSQVQATQLPSPQQQQRSPQVNGNSGYSSLDPLNDSSRVSSGTSGTGLPLSTGLVGPRAMAEAPGNQVTHEEDQLPPGTTINNGKTFGVEILNLLNSEEDLVPLLVTRCIEMIELHGITLEGIYRMSLNLSKLKELRELIDADPININTKIVLDANSMDNDIYLVLSLLKLFFASLPTPLLGASVYGDLVGLMKIPDSNDRYITLHHIIYKLDDESYWTLRALVLHLSKVVSFSESNKMTEKNLGIVWGPTLMFSEDPEELQVQSKIVEELIINLNNLYRDY